jgi:GT2 family glycosyltransferase
MTTSVIIATYNRAPLLDECLAHLGRQPFEAGDEVLVVDNGSTDDTSGVVAGHQPRFPVPLRLLTETRPGKSIAIAAALEVACGDILAFTDEDAIRRALADDAGSAPVVLVGGRVKPRWESTPPFWLELGRGYGRFGAPLALLDYGSEPIDLGPRTLLGANMAIRRDVVQRLGGFASHLGKLRGTLLSGEDHELCRRVQRAGFRARYCPDAVVAHWVPRKRMRVGYFLKWFFWSGITNAELEGGNGPEGLSIFGVPLFLFRLFASGVAGAVAAAAAWKWPRAVDRATEAAFAAGYAARRSGVV